jgi:hypothetical protein
MRRHHSADHSTGGEVGADQSEPIALYAGVRKKTARWLH